MEERKNESQKERERARVFVLLKIARSLMEGSNWRNNAGAYDVR